MSRKGDGADGDLPAIVSHPAEADPEEASPAAEEPAREPDPVVESPPAEEMEALRREREELRDSLLRRRAEFENYRRRVDRDRAVAAVEAEAAILRPLLATVDNLERALAASGSDSPLREGVELTLRDLVALLESLGVAALAPLGGRFDPSFHEAIVHEPAPGFEPGTVAEVFRKGYTFKDLLLRPALVKVASAATEHEGDDGAEGR